MMANFYQNPAPPLPLLRDQRAINLPRICSGKGNILPLPRDLFCPPDRTSFSFYSSNRFWVGLVVSFCPPLPIPFRPRAVRRCPHLRYSLGPRQNERILLSLFSHYLGSPHPMFHSRRRSREYLWKETPYRLPSISINSWVILLNSNYYEN